MTEKINYLRIAIEAVIVGVITLVIGLLLDFIINWGKSPCKLYK